MSKKDKKLAKEIGMSLDEFQKMVGYDLTEEYPEFSKAEENPSDSYEEIPDHLLTFKTDEDVSKSVPENLRHFWTKPVLTEEDEVLYYGYHIHSKDNVYGLHAHYPGGPLGGGHTHGPQNRAGYHTHKFDIAKLQTLKFSQPGQMIQLDGAHYHAMNAPDGPHEHNPDNFGPV